MLKQLMFKISRPSPISIPRPLALQYQTLQPDHLSLEAE